MLTNDDGCRIDPKAKGSFPEMVEIPLLKGEVLFSTGIGKREKIQGSTKRQKYEPFIGFGGTFKIIRIALGQTKQD